MSERSAKAVVRGPRAEAAEAAVADVTGERLVQRICRERGVTAEATFGRAIDIAAIDVSAIGVDDGAAGYRFAGAPGTAVLVGPAAVEVQLVSFDEFAGPGTTMNASAANGIVAAAPPVGVAWAGVSELALPWP